MMTTITALTRDASGQIMLPGYRTDVLTDVDFRSLSAIPAILTTSGGAMSGSSPNGVMVLSTSATQYSTASVSAPTVVTTDWQWIKLSIDFLIPAASAPLSGDISLAGSSIGAKWSNSSKVLNSLAGGDTDLQIGQYITFGSLGRETRRVAELLIIPARKLAAALDGYGGVHGAAIFPGFTGGTLTPKFTIQASSAGVKTVSVRRITVTAGK